MQLQIVTPTGTATIKNSQSKQGYKALLLYIKRMQADKTPFIVLPNGTITTDLLDAVYTNNYA